MKIKDLPKVDRPREKLVAKGAENLKDSELLAILLRTGRAGHFCGLLFTNSVAIFKPSLLVSEGNSDSCASMERTCLSSTSVDLRA